MNTPKESAALDPFELLSNIPYALKTTDSNQRVTVFNCDPVFMPDTPNDRFGLTTLLGELAGTHPYGVQTEERQKIRREFDALVALPNRLELLQNLGRLGFFDIAQRAVSPDDNPSDAITRMSRDISNLRLPNSQLVLIVQDLDVWKTLELRVKQSTSLSPYRAQYTRRKPLTEKGMAWVICRDAA